MGDDLRLVAAVYALVIAGVGGLLDVAGAAWLPWVAAGVVAVSFAPLRDELQRGVNRITYGRWDEPYYVLAGLGQRLEATADADRLLEAVVLELTSGWNFGIADRGIPAPVAGAGTEAAVAVPLSSTGDRSGRSATTRGARAQRDRRLLDDLAVISVVFCTRGDSTWTCSGHSSACPRA